MRLNKAENEEMIYKSKMEIRLMCNRNILYKDQH